MATLERSRRLIGGVWKYVTADEDSGGNGGSVPGSVRRLDLGVVSIADLADGSITLYTPAAGEMVGPVILYDTSWDSSLLFVVGRDEQVINGDAEDWEANGPLGYMEEDNAVDSYQMPSGLSLAPSTSAGYITPVTFGPVTAGLIGERGAGYLGTWQANHAYAGNSSILAAGHIWVANSATGDPGTSGGAEPDFAGNIGGDVVDNDITWTDYGEIGTGSAHVYAESCVPVVP